MSDASILIDDGAIDLKLGAAAVSVRPLTIESSAQWCKRVRHAFIAQARENNALQVAAQAENWEGIESLLEGKAFGDILTVRDLLIEHSPAVLCAEVVNRATAQQIVTAFDALFREENPLARLRAVMART